MKRRRTAADDGGQREGRSTGWRPIEESDVVALFGPPRYADLLPADSPLWLNASASAAAGYDN